MNEHVDRLAAAASSVRTREAHPLTEATTAFAATKNEQEDVVDEE